MAKKKKKVELSSEGKTELAKAIAEKSQNFAKTYARIEILVSRFFRWLSGWLDRLLFNQKHGKAVALILAILLYVTFNAADANIFETTKSAQELGNYKISQVISTQNYEVSGLPQSVKVTAIGDLSDIQGIKQRSGIRVVADMTNLTEGVHEVKFTTEGAPSQVDLVVEPSSAMVTIKKKSIRKFSVGFDYLNRNSMDPIYDLSAPEMEQGEVLVRASTDTLDKIAYVKALIKVNFGITSDFETKATVYAYDGNGKRMNVDIIPNKIPVKVKVTKPSKEVAVVLNPTGTIPNGKAIESYSIDYPKVTIFGNASLLEGIKELPITIPASTLTSDREITMPIILPNGVTKVSPKNIVNISIKLADMKTKDIDDVDIKISNATAGYTFYFENKDSTTVTLKGAESVIEAIKKEDLSVTADVSKINKEGVYEVPLLVSGKNRLASYELQNAVIKVRAVKAK